MGRQSRKMDTGIDPPRVIENGLSQAVKPETAAALPIDGLGYATLFTLDHLLQARSAVAYGVIPHLDPDVAPSHLVRNGAGRAGPEKGVQNEVAGIGDDL